MDISISYLEFTQMIEEAVENGFRAGVECTRYPDEMIPESVARREFDGFVNWDKCGLYKKTTNNRKYRSRDELVKERAKRNIRNITCEMVYKTQSRK